MRICGKRVSAFTQGELRLMKRNKEDFSGKRLTPGQLREIKKVYDIRKLKAKEAQYGL